MLLIDKCPNCLNTKYLYSTQDELQCGACGYESDNLERDYYTVKFRDKLTSVLQLARGNKTADYGEAWQRTGLVGIYIKLMIKESRLRSLVWEGKEPKVDESVEDTLKDIIAYATYGLLCIDDGNVKGVGEHEARLEDMLKTIEEELENVRSN